jgi:hypothetical protein
MHPRWLVCLWLAVSCTRYDSYVKTDQTALGRIVVYRNGIAYYERRAQVLGERMNLEVPSDKIDDFLKSLTVLDGKTGKPLPVSFPTQGATRGNSVDMTIQLPGKGPHDLLLTYIVEAPAWKPSYRVVVRPQGKIKLEGWAIVDNVSGEDWKGVKVGVGSSSALSFRYDLRSVRLVYRETLATQDRFVQAPPVGGSVHQEKPSEEVYAQLSDSDIAAPQGHPEGIDTASMAPEAAPMARGRVGSKAPAAVSRAAPDPDMSYQQGQRAQAHQRVRALAQKLNSHARHIVIEGYAGPGEMDVEARSLDRANVLRNQLIEAGVAPSRLRVVGKGVAPGQGAGVKLVEEKAQATEAVDHGEPVGDSHFESQTAVTVARGTSAMVSIVDAQADGEIVYLYDAEAQRGDERFAFRAVRFANPSDSTLEAGPMTFYGDGRFIGEGLADPIPPKATAVVPFALDRQVVVERERKDEDRIARLFSLQRGVMTAEVKHLLKTQLKLTNRLHVPVTVYVRHMVRKGWSLESSPKVVERLGDAHLFAVRIAAGATESVEITQATPMERTIDLRSPTGLELARVYLEAPLPSGNGDGTYVETMRKILALHAEMVDHQQMLESLRERMDEYRVRMDELEAQIVSLKSARAGAELLGHLQTKMKDISERVQKATLDAVDRQEKLMLAKIRFQDAIAELSLERKANASR